MNHEFRVDRLNPIPINYKYNTFILFSYIAIFLKLINFKQQKYIQIFQNAFYRACP